VAVQCAHTTVVGNEERAMTSVSIDFSDPAVQADPYSIYAQLRAESPVVWNEVTQSWLVSRYDDITQLFNDPRMSSARTEAIFRVLPPEAQAELEPLRHVLGSRMLLTDPPEHTRLKNLVMKAFSASATNTRRDRIAEICDELMDRVVERGELDVMRDLATQAPSWVIADLLGVPRDEQGTFARWAHDQVRVYDRPGTTHDRVEVMRQGQASMLEMKAYLEEIIAARRAEPRADLITQLVQAEEQGDRLTTDEMVIMVVAILVGGNNSTAHAIGNAVLTLLRQPDAVEQLRADPGLIRTAFEEVLRFESPVQSTSRVASEPLELHGQTLGARDNVHLLIGSANRDESQFPDPTRYDPTRQPNRHLTFAHGPHFCLGTSVARATAQIAVGTLLRRCDGLELVSETPDWNPGFSFRSVKTLPVRFSNA
jgi:cytochrome P450